MDNKENGLYEDRLGQELEKYLQELDAYNERLRREQEEAEQAAEDQLLDQYGYSERYLDELADEEERRYRQEQERTLQTYPEEYYGDEDVEDEDEEQSLRTKKKPRKKWSRTKKIVVSIICIILVLAIAASAFIYSKLNLIDTNGDDFLGTDTMENDIDANSIDSITNAAGLQDLLEKWATNGGDHMHSKYVKNVLLLGVDSDSKLSDTMMLASVNRRTQKISLVSFYRDSYTYIKTDSGKESFAKLNAAYSYGGADLVVKTIENNYKIDIDDYVMVDYNSFPQVIDALGGVTVNVTEKEANYLNKTWWRWTRTGKQISFNSGDMKMDGEHALMYARIRKLDSDVQRTERQRKVITAIMESFKNASASELNSAINTLFPNVKTSLSKKNILSYASLAVSEGWLNWTMEQQTMPPDDCCAAGYAGTQWIWICDYEGGAYVLQNLLYGETNITLADNRVSALDFAKGQTSATTYSTNRSSRQTYSYNTTARTNTYSTTGYTNGSVEPVLTEDSYQPTNANAGWGGIDSDQ